MRSLKKIPLKKRSLFIPLLFLILTSILGTSLKASAADESHDCLIAGWPTKRLNNRCGDPGKHNQFYNKFKQCSSGEVLCNPAVFGIQECIDISTQSLRNTSFSRCRRAAQNTNIDKITNDDDHYYDRSDHPDHFWDTLQSVNDICNVQSGRQSRSSMCHALKMQVDPALPYMQGLQLKNPKTLRPQQLGSEASRLVDLLEDEVEQFEKNCDPIDEGNYTATLHCHALAKRIPRIQKNLQSTLAYIEKLAEEDEHGQSSCVSHQQLSLMDINQIKAQLKCEENKGKDNFMHALMCAANNIFQVDLGIISVGSFASNKKLNCPNSSGPGCLQQAVIGFFKSIISTIKGIVNLLKMGVQWVGNKAKDFWQWVRGIEDVSADKQAAIGELNDQEAEKVKKDFGGWLREKFAAVSDMVKHFLTHDAMCQQWERPATMSGECLQPANWDCLSAQDKINGYCSVMGHLGGEIIGVAFAAGAATKVVSVGSRAMGQALRASGRYQRIASRVQRVARTPASISRVMNSTIASRIVSSVKATGQAIAQQANRIANSAAYQKAASMGAALGKTPPARLAKQFIRFETRVFQAGQNTVTSLIGNRLTSVPTVVSARTGRVFLDPTVNETRRAGYAEKLLDRKLSSEQRNAVINAHNVGRGQIGRDGTLAGLENYTLSQIRQKHAQLRAAGFSPQEIRLLMDKGVVGNSSLTTSIQNLGPARTTKSQSLVHDYINTQGRALRRTTDPKQRKILIEEIADNIIELRTNHSQHADRIEKVLSSKSVGIKEELKELIERKAARTSATTNTVNPNTAAQRTSASTSTTTQYNHERTKQLLNQSSELRPDYISDKVKEVNRNIGSKKSSFKSAKEEYQRSLNQVNQQMEALTAQAQIAPQDRAYYINQRIESLKTSQQKLTSEINDMNKSLQRYEKSYNNLMGVQPKTQAEWKEVYSTIDGTPNARRYAAQIKDAAEKPLEEARSLLRTHPDHRPANFDEKLFRERIKQLELDIERADNLLRTNP